LLRLLTKELSEQSPEIGAWAASEIASLQLTGIAAPTVAAFDEYRKKYEDLNEQLDSQATESSLAAHYFAQVRRLGDMLATKLKLRMTTDAASGDYGKTIAAITAVLNEEEASSNTGHVLYSGRDPGSKVKTSRVPCAMARRTPDGTFAKTALAMVSRHQSPPADEAAPDPYPPIHSWNTTTTTPFCSTLIP